MKNTSPNQDKSTDNTRLITIIVKDDVPDINASFKEIFDIPIYRCSLEQHKLELDQEKENFISVATGDSPEMKRIRKGMSIAYDNSKWYMWKYNEIIGWISLYSTGQFIRGDLYLPKNKRLTRRCNKTFVSSRITFDVLIASSDSKDVIFTKILKQLRSLPSIYPILKKRYIDLTKFENIGRFIDWHSLVRT